MTSCNCEIVDSGAFCEVIFFSISPKNLLGDFFDSLANLDGIEIFSELVKRKKRKGGRAGSDLGREEIAAEKRRFLPVIRRGREW